MVLYVSYTSIKLEKILQEICSVFKIKEKLKKKKNDNSASVSQGLFFFHRGHIRVSGKDSPLPSLPFPWLSGLQKVAQHLSQMVLPRSASDSVVGPLLEVIPPAIGVPSSPPPSPCQPYGWPYFQYFRCLPSTYFQTP